MAIRKLMLDDFIEDDVFSLIGIHCTIEDYRLAYQLNKTLKINLARQKTDFNFGNTNYSIFEWNDEHQLSTWNLVCNTSKTETNNDLKNNNLNTLFDDNLKGVEISYLIKEYKKVNYFLKISEQLTTEEELLIVKKLSNIPQIITAYSINTEQLKSKTNLIFN